MKLAAALYLALATAANAQGLDGVALEGDMRKLVVHDAPKEVSAAPMQNPEGETATLSDWSGKHVLLNFWATWCAPCREEMPSLDALQTAMGGEAFEVVTLATGRNSVEGIEDFFAEVGVETLPIWLDPKQGIARDMAVLGLPITVLIDPEGREVARLTGDADWNAPEARAVIEEWTGAGS
ncbi:TlpA family protein disulfide reductase [Palleronia sediminis]|uniref:TlpA family protein disulfide reductase n=2 Tax=Palleronia sediminis TaxID=2547833 RepID=A0A4R6A0J2_9RHOB|nr:TlpA disulfide reductase family protein [Palleronia sediminis]TDL76064.1 TlpA family protein disulfide reductase [Palleronia sediminis]